MAERLALISSPVLFVAGSHDSHSPAFLVKKSYEAFRSLNKNKSHFVQIEKATHSLPWWQ